MFVAQNAVLERTPFAIDDPQDEYSDDEELMGGDEHMMDEVDAFLEENDPGLSEADRALQKGGDVSAGELCCSLTILSDLLTASPIK